jgi:hypothetical protein
MGMKAYATARVPKPKFCGNVMANALRNVKISASENPDGSDRNKTIGPQTNILNDQSQIFPASLNNTRSFFNSFGPYTLEFSPILRRRFASRSIYSISPGSSSSHLTLMLTSITKPPRPTRPPATCSAKPVPSATRIPGPTQPPFSACGDGTARPSTHKSPPIRLSHCRGC